MKLTNLLLICLAVLFSCSDDDDPVPTSQGMVGTWSITAVDYRGTTTTTSQGGSVKADYTGTGKDIDVTVTFNENPNTVTSEGSYVIVLKTTMQGQTTTEEYPFDEAFSDGTWTLSGNALTITDVDGPQTATILEQTKTTLKMRLDLKETETVQGITIAINVQTTFTLTKK